MNTIATLQLAFAPTSELNSWVPPIELTGAAPAKGARALARFNVRESRTTSSVRLVKLQPRSGLNAAPLRSRFSRRRLFPSTHKVEHAAPAAVAGTLANRTFPS